MSLAGACRLARWCPAWRWRELGLGSDNEILAIQRALEEHGPTERQKLADLVGARYWGPGVFRETLREATADGHIRRTSRNTYAPADDDNNAKQ